MDDFDLDSDTSSSSSESDNEIFDVNNLPISDEEFENGENNRKRPKNEGFFEITIPQYNDEEFIEHFRVSRNVSQMLSVRYENSSEYYKYQTGGNGKLESYRQIVIYLWFVGHQTASFRDVADRFDIAISTLFAIIRKVTYFLSNISHEVISWPSNAEQQEIERSFRRNNFPGVIGAIDGCHIKIDKPSNDPDSYLNRKHFFSIQMQVVCDHRRKIRDVFVGYPGSVHDSRVFRTSPLFDSLQEKCGRYYLLGDSAYPCLPNLLTPFKDRGQLTRRQRNFNLKHAKTRYVIEHCFGLMKQKFRQLFHLKLRSIPDMTHFIRACCVLHNLALEDDFPFAEENTMHVMNAGNGNNNDDDYDEDPGRDDRNGIEIRNGIANNLPM